MGWGSPDQRREGWALEVIPNLQNSRHPVLLTSPLKEGTLAFVTPQPPLVLFKIKVQP